MEIAESIVKPPLGHESTNENCPFCEDQNDDDTYTTHHERCGSFASILEDTSRGSNSTFIEKQQNAHPNQAKNLGTKKPRGLKKSRFQAHHLISISPFKRSSVLNWVKKSNLAIQDTGYSINNAKNGCWAPSPPANILDSKSGDERTWGSGGDEDKQRVAEKIMKKAQFQLHIGQHTIGSEGLELSMTYEQYVEKMLELFEIRIQDWSKACFQCNDPPHPTTPRIHHNLDNLSNHIQMKLRFPARRWKIFLSKYARDYCLKKRKEPLQRLLQLIFDKPNRP